MTRVLTLVCTCCLLALAAGPPNPSFKQFHSVESHEIQPGILITPIYSAKGEVCQISIEKRHYWDNKVNIDTALSKDQIRRFFDQLVEQKQRGGPGLKLPEGTELTDVDGGVRATHIVYENVSLTMYGRAESPDFVTAVITWNNSDCASH